VRGLINGIAPSGREEVVTVGTQLAALCATSGRPTARPGTVSCRRRVRGHVCPDERDTQPGRERPPPDRARDRVRGVAAGVAHAPAATSLLSQLHRAGTRGTKRRANFASATSSPTTTCGTSPSRIRLSPRAAHALRQGPRRGTTPPGPVVPPAFAGPPNYAEPTRGERWA